MIFLHLLQVVTSATLLTETFDGGNFTFFGSIPAKITIEPNLRHLKGFWDIESSDYKKVTFSSFWIYNQTSKYGRQNRRLLGIFDVNYKNGRKLPEKIIHYFGV